MIICEKERMIHYQSNETTDLAHVTQTLKDLTVEAASANRHSVSYSIDQDTASPAEQRIFAELSGTIGSFTHVYNMIANAFGWYFSVAITSNQRGGFTASNYLITISWI